LPHLQPGGGGGKVDLKTLQKKQKGGVILRASWKRKKKGTLVWGNDQSTRGGLGNWEGSLNRKEKMGGEAKGKKVRFICNKACQGQNLTTGRWKGNTKGQGPGC